MSNIYGDIFLPASLIEASENLLKKWFPLYLAELERRLTLSPGTLKIPENYSQRGTLVSIPGEDLPKCLVLTPGIMGTPVKNGYGAFRATWRLGVGILVAAKSEEEAFQRASYYGSAIMAIFMHHTSILGIASDTNLLDFALGEIPAASEHWNFRGAAIEFGVEIDNIVIKNVGPKDPDIARGTAEKVIITSGKNPI